jgi:hypothetical protein
VSGSIVVVRASNVRFDGFEPRRRRESMDDRHVAQFEESGREGWLLGCDENASTQMTLLADDREQCFRQIQCFR